MEAGPDHGRRFQGRIRVESSQRCPETGHYSYDGHRDGEEGCYVSPYAGGMPFSKGPRAPNLLSCSHVIYWKLDIIY
ncbi:hypothetical protein IBTHAUMO2_690008 [Nitrosopumilaceae archaeon]|nr:hypothetical protein [Nitrosopumilus sp.]CAI9832262.1 hypothetical protein IBTHAUMO2_690008 [Nitrosopumilaceae archaeon]MDA7945458.1 hypothetical protein [Nitrosopumilus sp.]MDA7955246.1 hypothetical protein [Nitrosopumilus sp.]MDA7974021.1 hypothetical protein [Nitrosopumilus sp.]